MTRFIEKSIVGGGDSFTNILKAIYFVICRKIQGFSIEYSYVNNLHWIDFWDSNYE